MHKERLSFLAWQHPVYRAIVNTDRRTDGVTFTLECGHTSHGVQHFDYSRETTRQCYECSVEHIRTDPRWAHEFADTKEVQR